MGAPWSYYDSWTETVRLLYCTVGFSQYVAEAWEQFQVWQDEQCGVLDTLKSVKRPLEPLGQSSAEVPLQTRSHIRVIE